MYATIELDRTVTLFEAPSVPKLAFRGFRGEEDYPAMAAVIDGSKDADGQEWTLSVEDIARNYRHLRNSDPGQDMLFVEADGEVVGYGRVWWTQEAEGTRLYQQFAHLLPDWRGKAIRRSMLHHNEHRLRQIAEGHPLDGPRMFEAWASDTETHWQSLLLDEAYEPVRYGFEMVRPDLEEIPALSLPDGLQVQPVQPEHVLLIWTAAREAFRDHWGYAEDEWSDENLKEWQESPMYDPGLWQVAWEGDQVAGTVLNFINYEENEEYGRKRGYTEGICVRRPWRRQGVARALIACSFRVLKELGMTEAALGVDAQNPNGALRLYKSMGFEPVKEHTTYRKLLA